MIDESVLNGVAGALPDFAWPYFLMSFVDFNFFTIKKHGEYPTPKEVFTLFDFHFMPSLALVV
jgi:hypothetical protein